VVTYPESIGALVWDPFVEVPITLNTSPFAIAAEWVTQCATDKVDADVSTPRSLCILLRVFSIMTCTRLVAGLDAASRH
jgi:hypothetical protein